MRWEPFCILLLSDEIPGVWHNVRHPYNAPEDPWDLEVLMDGVAIAPRKSAIFLLICTDQPSAQSINEENSVKCPPFYA